MISVKNVSRFFSTRSKKFRYRILNFFLYLRKFRYISKIKNTAMRNYHWVVSVTTFYDEWCRFLTVPNRKFARAGAPRVPQIQTPHSKPSKIPKNRLNSAVAFSFRFSSFFRQFLQTIRFRRSQSAWRRTFRLRESVCLTDRLDLLIIHVGFVKSNIWLAVGSATLGNTHYRSSGGVSGS